MAHEEGDSAETEERNPNSRVAWMARAQRAEAELADHRKHVGAFLNDLYAMLIDPCATKDMTVTDCCERLLSGAEAQRQYIADQDAALSALRSRVAELEGALAFYAEPLRWKSTSLYMCGHRSPAPILTDEGHRARAALTKEPTP